MNTSKLIHTFFFMVVITLVALPKSTLAGGKPDKCGDGVCKGNETPATCEADCDGGGDPPVSVGTSMCYIEATEDTGSVRTVASTVLDDSIREYENGEDKVTCGIGDVVSDNKSPLRFRSLTGGNITKAIRFIDLDFNLADCEDVEPGGCAAIPTDFMETSLETAQLNVKPFSADFDDHVYKMDPGSTEPARLIIDPDGYVERYSIQMMGFPGAQASTRCLNIDDFHLIGGNPPNDDPYYGINVYAWLDGVYGAEDGYPDGYTVTTGSIYDEETATTFPKVVSTDDTQKALVCSNIGVEGEPCENRKQRDALCYTLGVVEMHFTMHFVVP
jgi:hypothetical protein